MGWSDDCPARTAGLGHAHWDKCDPRTGHPGAVPPVTHLNSECCHCGLKPGDFSHGEPGAFDCNYPSCSVEGHKRQIPSPYDAEDEADRMMREHVMREAGIPPEFLIDRLGGPAEKRHSIGEWFGPWPTSVRTAPPDGKPYGLGRSWDGDGKLSVRDEARLEFNCLRTPRFELDGDTGREIRP